MLDSSLTKMNTPSLLKFVYATSQQLTRVATGLQPIFLLVTSRKFAMRSTATVTGAAIAGLMSEAFAAISHAAVSIGKPGVSVQAGKMESDKNSCEGKNSCKGKGGCKLSAFLPIPHLDNCSH